MAATSSNGRQQRAAGGFSFRELPSDPFQISKITALTPTAYDEISSSFKSNFCYKMIKTSEMLEKGSRARRKTVQLGIPADAGPTPGRHPKDRSRRPGLSFGVSGGRKRKNGTRPKVTRNRPNRCPKGDSTLEIVVGRSAAAVP